MADENAQGAGGSGDGTTGAGGQAPQSEQGDQRPPWGEDFSPERAWNTIKTLRDAEKERNELRAKVQTLEDKDKSETERIASENQRLKSDLARLQEAEKKLVRFEVATEKGIPHRLASRLQGSTREELEQDADRLREDFGLVDDEDTDAGRRPNFDAGVRNGGASRAPTMNDTIRAFARGR